MYNAYFGDILNHVIEEIDKVENSLHIAMAWFTHQTIYEIILNKAASGVKVDLIISNSEANYRPGHSLNFDQLQKKGADVRVLDLGTKNFMHHKFVVIDKHTLITGSYNWSYNANTNFENVIIAKDEKIALVYELQFKELQKNSACIPLNEFKASFNSVTAAQIQQTDAQQFELANQFSEQLNQSIAEARKVNDEYQLKISFKIVEDLIRRYTAIGAAAKLSLDPEQGGFQKIVGANRPDLTFEYLVAKSQFAPLFNKRVIQKAKDKLRPSLKSAVDNL